MLSLLLLSAASTIAQTPAGASPVDLARRQVVAFFGRMSDLTCTENVVQEKLAPNGHVQSSVRSQYDYLIMVDSGKDDLHWNESRIESANGTHQRLPLLITNGFSMLLLVFHPYYRDSFRFSVGATQQDTGQTLLPIQFSHVSGTRSPAALALRGREFPLDLRGTAWIDPRNGQIMKMEASLLRDMSDIGLRSLTVQVDYTPSQLASLHGMALPDRAVIDLRTARQHWRNVHVFASYKSFSTAAELGPTVKVVAAGSPAQPSQRETPGSSPKEPH